MEWNPRRVVVESLDLASAARRQNKERIENGKPPLPVDEVKQVQITDEKEPRLLL